MVIQELLKPGMIGEATSRLNQGRWRPELGCQGRLYSESRIGMIFEATSRFSQY